MKTKKPKSKTRLAHEREVRKNRKKWVAALRSGKFKQGKGHLKHDYKAHLYPYGTQHDIRYCCLGVACEVIPGLKKSLEDELLQESCALRKLGLSPGEIFDGGDYVNDQTRLASRNDSGLSFKKIAKLIEALPIA